MLKVLGTAAFYSWREATGCGSEVYDRATDSWGSSGDLFTPSWFHTLTLLPSGKVLKTGGGRDDTHCCFAATEIFDAASESWSPGARAEPDPAPAAADHLVFYLQAVDKFGNVA